MRNIKKLALDVIDITKFVFCRVAGRLWHFFVCGACKCLIGWKLIRHLYLCRIRYIVRHINSFLFSDF